MIGEVRNGNATSYTYDDLNRLTAIAYTGASGENASYTYDALSRLLTAANEAGTVTATYDNRGRLGSETDVFGHVMGYTYDAAGNRTALTLDSTAQTGYAYDNANRLTTLTDEASNNFTFAYDNANKLISKVMPNGITSTYTYDGMNRLKELKHATSASTLYDDQFTYNSANQISQIAGLSATKNYTYDNIDRLVSVTVGGSTVESYAYDAVGNRTASHLSSGYTTGSFNRLTATNAASYTYNTNGSMTGKTVSSTSWTYGWDRENRMTSVGNGTNSVSYAYDALGRRVKRTESSDVQKYTHDGLDVVLDDINSTLTKYQNGRGIDNKLKLASGGTSKYFLQDQTGSTVSLSNSSGSVTDSNSYDSFGNATNGSFSSRYRYTGREIDTASSLNFYRARWYDSETGRFASEDPIGFRGRDINLYGYVWNRPTKLVDPSGLQGIGSGDTGDREFWKKKRAEQYAAYLEDQARKKESGSLPENFQCGPYPDAPLDYVPQHPFGYNFRDAGCRGHDACYGRCGADKHQCDLALWSDLNLECARRNPWGGNPDCYILAAIYYGAVNNVGQSAFDEAQASGCCNK